MKNFTFGKFLLFTAVICFAVSEVSAQLRKAPAPLFRDPITDGAADPVLIWNRQEKSWWMLYTQRRANQETANVAYCYGNPIGIASTDDNGRTWVYRGTLDLEIDKGHNTFWAPDIVYHEGVYHLFVAYIKGVRTNWGGQAHIAHFTSGDMWEWKYEGIPELSSNSVIDATLIRLPDGGWRMWYKDQSRGSVTMMADSKDLKNWKFDDKPAIGGGAHEGAKAFRFGDYYWMVTDEWQGMRVYRSDDLINWEKQGLILDQPGTRFLDTPQGAHGDVVVFGDKAYVFYFTHPGRSSHGKVSEPEMGIIPFRERMSLIQVAPLVIKDGILTCDRNADFDFFMPPME